MGTKPRGSSAAGSLSFDREDNRVFVVTIRGVAPHCERTTAFPGKQSTSVDERVTQRVPLFCVRKRGLKTQDFFLSFVLPFLDVRGYCGATFLSIPIFLFGNRVIEMSKGRRWYSCDRVLDIGGRFLRRWKQLLTQFSWRNFLLSLDWLTCSKFCIKLLRTSEKILSQSCIWFWHICRSCLPLKER